MVCLHRRAVEDQRRWPSGDIHEVAIHSELGPLDERYGNVERSFNRVCAGMCE